MRHKLRFPMTGALPVTVVVWAAFTVALGLATALRCAWYWSALAGAGFVVSFLMLVVVVAMAPDGRRVQADQTQAPEPQPGVWPPPPTAPPVVAAPARAGVSLPAGLAPLCFSALGWVLLAHGLLRHLPPVRYYHDPLFLAAAGLFLMRRGRRRSRLEGVALFSCTWLCAIGAIVGVLHVTSYF